MREEQPYLSLPGYCQAHGPDPGPLQVMHLRYFKWPKDDFTQRHLLEVTKWVNRNMYSFHRQTERSPIDSTLDPRADPKYFNYTWTNFMDYYEPLQPKNVINLSYPDNWGQSNMHCEIDIQRLVSKKYQKINEW